MQIHESSENYLEAILMIREEKGLVRSIDVAGKLGFSKPSISRAMSILRENGYIDIGDDGHITLTKSGEDIAQRIYERHRLLTRWLVWLGVSEDAASEDACRLEHDVSQETFDKLKEHIMSEIPEK
jgi:DtxR family Mn-dependent transcriptional regulator